MPVAHVFPLSSRKRIRLSGMKIPDSGVITATFWSARTRQTNPIAWAALSASSLPQGTGTDKKTIARRTRYRFAIPHLPFRRGGDPQDRAGPLPFSEGLYTVYRKPGKGGRFAGAWRMQNNSRGKN